MLVYHYNPITYEYLGSSTASVSPLEPGKFLCPANATFMAPMVIEDSNQIQVFDEDTVSWSIVCDFRGQRCYKKTNGESYVILVLNENIPDTHVTDAPPEGIFKPQWNGAEWIETALLFQDKIVENKLDVDAITKMRISALDEEKVKTEYMESIYNGDAVPVSWLTFIEQRAIILQEGNSFIAENSLV